MLAARLVLGKQILVGMEISPDPEGWPASAPRDSELDLPFKID